MPQSQQTSYSTQTHRQQEGCPGGLLARWFNATGPIVHNDS
jgi:hypothetical protein